MERDVSIGFHYKHVKSYNNNQQRHPGGTQLNSTHNISIFLLNGFALAFCSFSFCLVPELHPQRYTPRAAELHTQSSTLRATAPRSTPPRATELHPQSSSATPTELHPQSSRAAPPEQQSCTSRATPPEQQSCTQRPAPTTLVLVLKEQTGLGWRTGRSLEARVTSIGQPALTATSCFLGYSEVMHHGLTQAESARHVFSPKESFAGGGVKLSVWVEGGSGGPRFGEVSQWGRAMFYLHSGFISLVSACFG